MGIVSRLALSDRTSDFQEQITDGKRLKLYRLWIDTFESWQSICAVRTFTN